VFFRETKEMKLLCSAIAALTMVVSGSALADRDDRGRDGHNRYGHDRDHDRGRDHGKAYKHHYRNHQPHYYGYQGYRSGHQPHAHYYQAAPVYVAPPRYNRHRHYGYNDSGITIILPPIHLGR
jgi:Ni/Co efflux regulator RcnB